MSLETTDLWYTRCGAATTSALAIAKQFLQAEFDGPGTRLRSLRDDVRLAIRNAHYDHSQTGMFREGGNIPPIWARAAGQDTAVIAITWLDEYQGVLVRDDGPIRDIADLRGARLGIPTRRRALIDFQRGAALHGFVHALTLAGLAADEARFVALDAPEFDTEDGPRPAERPRPSVELEALRRGEVDAVFLRFAQGVAAARTPGVRQLIDLGHHPDPRRRVNNGTPRPVTVDRAFLRRHPDIVARYLAVLLRTAVWAEQHADEVLRLLQPPGVSAADVIASHGPQVHRSFHPDLDEARVAGLAQQKDFLRDHGFLAADFLVSDWIDPGPLAQARRLVAARPPLLEPAPALAA